MLVKLADCITKAIKDAELVAGRDHVDVTNLLGFNRIAISLRYNP